MAQRTPLTREQITELRDKFNMFDENRDGTINFKELEKLMQCSGANPTKREVEDLIRKHDRVNEKTGECNGVLEFVEFCDVMAEWLNTDQNEELRLCFKSFDVNGDGYITRGELSRILCCKGYDKLTEDEFKCVDDMLSKADQNEDGKISIEEFIKYMTKA